MASDTALQQAQLLYVAYYGRPGDPAGLRYWADRIESEGVGKILNAFGTSREYDARFGELSPADLVNNLYQQLFSRSAEPAGRDYYVGLLESGDKTLAEIAYEVASGAQNDDSTALDHKLAVAGEISQHLGHVDYPEEYQGNAWADTARGFLLQVDAGAPPSDTAIADFVAAQGSSLLHLSIQPEDWRLGTNTLSYQLEYDAAYQFEGVSMAGGGALSANTSLTTQAGVTQLSQSLALSNGRTEGTVTLAFRVPGAQRDAATVEFRDLVFNGEAYPDAPYRLANEAPWRLGADTLLPGYRLIDETPHDDTSGYATYYWDIREVLSLPDAQLMALSPGEPGQAYLHVEPGERFAFDHDTFVLDVDAGAAYRLKITPDDPSVFQSNNIAWVYDASADARGGVMNLIGGVYEGSIYSEIFTAGSSGEHFASLSMRWSSNDYQQTAVGPEPYTIELVAVDALGYREPTRIEETPHNDTTGYDTRYAHIDEVLLIEGARIGEVRSGEATRAYRHGPEFDEPFNEFDYDTFVLEAERSGEYRLRLTPDDIERFQGNLIVWLYDEEGALEDLVLNVIGRNATFHEGAAYTSIFSLEAGAAQHISVALSGDPVGDAPAGYQLELLGVEGGSEAWL